MLRFDSIARTADVYGLLQEPPTAPVYGLLRLHGHRKARRLIKTLSGYFRRARYAALIIYADDMVGRGRACLISADITPLSSF